MSLGAVISKKLKYLQQVSDRRYFRATSHCTNASSRLKRFFDSHVNDIPLTFILVSHEFVGRVTRFATVENKMLLPFWVFNLFAFQPHKLYYTIRNITCTI